LNISRLRDQENRGIFPGIEDELNQFLVPNDAEKTPFVLAQLQDTLNYFIQPSNLTCVLAYFVPLTLSFSNHCTFLFSVTGMLVARRWPLVGKYVEPEQPLLMVVVLERHQSEECAFFFCLVLRLGQVTFLIVLSFGSTIRGKASIENFSKIADVAPEELADVVFHG